MADKRGKPRAKPRQNTTSERLTKKQLRLLEVLVDPESRLLTVAQQCALVPCDRDLYYRAFKRADFKGRYEEMTKALAVQHAGAVVNAFVREAKRGSFPHGKVLLEMAGVYQPKEGREHTGKDGGPIEYAARVAGMTNEELERLVRDG